MFPSLPQNPPGLEVPRPVRFVSAILGGEGAHISEFKQCGPAHLTQKSQGFSSMQFHRLQAVHMDQMLPASECTVLCMHGLLLSAWDLQGCWKQSFWSMSLGLAACLWPLVSPGMHVGVCSCWMTGIFIGIWGTCQTKSQENPKIPGKIQITPKILIIQRKSKKP